MLHKSACCQLTPHLNSAPFYLRHCGPHPPWAYVVVRSWGESCCRKAGVYLLCWLLYKKQCCFSFVHHWASRVQQRKASNTYLSCELWNSFRDLLKLLSVRPVTWAHFYQYNKVRSHHGTQQGECLHPPIRFPVPPCAPAGCCCVCSHSSAGLLQGPLILLSLSPTVTNSVLALVKAWLDQGTLVDLAGFHTRCLSFKSARKIPMFLKTHIHFFFPLSFLFFFFFFFPSWSAKASQPPFLISLSAFTFISHNCCSYVLWW